ncbi:ATP-binding cassette domain-containing protein [Candidatus Micrarchaeota archaeon]|nr:ATP-binding cassette domain-containing protein [Candidatus Micrarchaeota archaeon]
MVIIQTKKITKKFGNITAVNELDLEIEEGEIFGLLGPNGAGKTTLISMLCTLLKPTAGSATVNSFDVFTQQLKVRKSIGIVFQEPSVDDLLSGRENLELHGMLYGMDAKEREKKIDEMLKLVDLVDRANDPVSTYSGGMRRRLEIARGLMHKPKILFLDEPTLGLDPASRKNIWDYIKSLAKEKSTTMVLTTHYMEEADMLCNRIGIISSGKIIALGTPAELKRKVGEDIVRIKGTTDLEKLKRYKFVKKVEVDGEYTELILDNAAENLQTLLAACSKLDSVEVRAVTLNDVFLHYTGKEIHDEEEGEGSWFERVMRVGGTRA